MQKRTKPSLRSRLIEWILWRIGVKRMFTRTEGLKEARPEVQTQARGTASLRAPPLSRGRD